MADSRTPPKPLRLRTPEDLITASEWLWNQGGQIDAKTADALNTTLKGSYNLIVKARLDLLKIITQAHVKKVMIPENLLPDFAPQK
jgi:hypothetical protein